MKPYLGWPWFSLSRPRADVAAVWVGHYRERRVKGVRGLQFAVGIGTTSAVTMISRVRSSGRPNTDLNRVSRGFLVLSGGGRRTGIERSPRDQSSRGGPGN